MAATSGGHALQAFDFDANRDRVLISALSRYRIVHFATHGFLDSQNPELSGLVFSQVDERGKARLGFVSLEDIYNMYLPADLVVLSACHTARGREVDGEGLVGLTRGFMSAGATRVIASLWNVNDAGTAEFMGTLGSVRDSRGLEGPDARKERSYHAYGIRFPDVRETPQAALEERQLVLLSANWPDRQYGLTLRQCHQCPGWPRLTSCERSVRSSAARATPSLP